MTWFARRRPHGIGYWVAVAVLVIAASAAAQDDGVADSPMEAPKEPVTMAPAAAAPPVAEVDDQAAEKPTLQGLKQAEQDAIKMTRPDGLQLHVQELEITKVLKLLSTQGGRNIIASKEVSGKVSVDLYGVTFDEALDAVLKATGFVHVRKGQFIYVMTAKQKQDMEKAERKLEHEVFRLHYVTPEDAKTIVTPALSQDGKVTVTPAPATGIATSDTDAGGNAYAMGDVLIVYDYKENIEKISKIIKDLDIKPDQLLVEATILSALVRDQDDLGLNFNAVAGIDFSSLGVTSTNLGNTSSYTASAAGNTEGKLGLAGARTNFAQVENGLTFGFLGNNIAIFLTALELVTDTTVLANPKLLILNKQRGEVLIGERQGYKTTTTTETTATETIEFLETGTRLVVRPFICRDRLIRLEIHPEESTGFIEDDLPREETTEVTSNILVRDGHTIVIGGLFKDHTSNTRNQVPILGNIPYAGWLFRRISEDAQRKEIIILITPHIVRQALDEAVSLRIKDDVDRYHIGERKGLQWWGRSRLAQAFMRRAKQAMRDGDGDKGMWNLDMVLSLDPRLLEAIRMKERLTEKAYWADETRGTSVKHVIEQMIMQELGKPAEQVIMPDRPVEADQYDEDVKEALGVGEHVEAPLPGQGRGKAAGKPSRKGPKRKGKMATQK